MTGEFPKKLILEFLTAETIHQDMSDCRLILLKIEPGLSGNASVKLDLLKEWIIKECLPK